MELELTWQDIWTYIINPIFFFSLIIMNILMTRINIDIHKTNKKRIHKNRKKIKSNHDIIEENMKKIEENHELIENFIKNNGISGDRFIKENKGLIAEMKELNKENKENA